MPKSNIKEDLKAKLRMTQVGEFQVLLQCQISDRFRVSAQEKIHTKTR